MMFDAKLLFDTWMVRVKTKKHEVDMKYRKIIDYSDDVLR